MLKIDNLEDNVLFVSDTDYVVVSTSYFSNYLQNDSIYYTDGFSEDTTPYSNGLFDIKIYNLKERRFSQHSPFNN